VLMGWDEKRSGSAVNLAAFVQGHQQWLGGRSHVRYRLSLANGDINRTRMFAKDLVDLN